MRSNIKKFRVSGKSYTVRDLVNHVENVYGLSEALIRARLKAGDDTLNRVLRRAAARTGSDLTPISTATIRARLKAGDDTPDLTPVTVPPDEVNHPPHYTAGPIEAIEAIAAALTPEEFRGYLKGNALKYLWRERHKGGEESLRKAEWYLKRMVQ
jgi:hypothetical protein